MIESTRMLAKQILEKAHAFDWSLQGLGMLRLHMGNFRLHVWDLRFAYPDASPIHDHLQWSLESQILSGHLVNYRFKEHEEGEPYWWVTLKAGYGCKFRHDPKRTGLIRLPAEHYNPGDVYAQAPNEIHETVPQNGTVTMMQKYPTSDGESARVFWPVGREWGSAEPRKASREEIDLITKHALSVWS